MDSEILNEKKRDREEKPEALASPENVSKKKKKRKIKEKDAVAEQQNQHPSKVCPKPLVVATPISVEGNLPDPKEAPKKKKKMRKKKSNLNGEQQELNKKEEEKGEVPNETNAQVCPPKPSLAIEVPTDLEMKTESLSHGQSQSSHAEAEGQNQHPSQVCPQPLVVPISVEANLVGLKDTPKKKRKQKKKKKKKNKSDLNGEQQELNKVELLNETNPPKPSLAFEVPTDLKMKTAALDHDQSQTKPQTLIPVSLIPQTSTVQPAIPIDTEQDLRKSKMKRGNKKRRITLDGVQPNEHNIETPVQSQISICHTPTPTINHAIDPHPAIPIFPKLVSPIKKPMDPQPVIPICPKQCSPIEQTIAVVVPVPKICPEQAPQIGQTIPVDPAISMDAPQIGQTIPVNRNKRKRMNKKRMLDGAQPSGHNIEQPETLVQSQTSICHTTTPPIDQTMDPHSVIPTFPKPVSPVKQTMDPLPAIPICPKPVSPIDQTISVVDPTLKICPEPAPQIGQTMPVDPTVSIDTEQKLSKSKRKMKKKMKRVLDGAQPNGPNIEQPETMDQSQTSICHTTTPPIDQTMDPHTSIPICPKPAALIDQTISVVDSALLIGPEPAPLISQTILVDPATPTGTHRKLSVNNRQWRRMVKKGLLSGEQPNGHNIKGSVRPTSPIDPEQNMTKGQSIMSALKIKGSESNGHNANSTAEAPFRETIEVTVTKDPSYRHFQRSKVCWACRKFDHNISQCRMLKSLSKDEEICFFCGEIGHSLGRCSVSLAGGGRLAKCLLCHANGHFSYNCPGDGHGNYLKGVAANGPIDRTARAGNGVQC